MLERARQDAREAGIVELQMPPLIDAKSRALVEAESARMIVGRGVHPDALRRAEPGAVDRRLDEISPEAAADEIGHEAEIAQFGGTRGGVFELEISRGHAGRIEDGDFDVVALEARRELLVAPLPPLEPQPRLAHGVVEEAIERDGAALGAEQRQLRRRHGP